MGMGAIVGQPKPIAVTPAMAVVINHSTDVLLLRVVFF